MGGGISVCNKTDVGPLHWGRVLPGETKYIACGKVWFTVSAKLWNNSEPSGWDVAEPLVIGVAGALAVVSGLALVYAAATAPAAGGAAATSTAGAIATGTAPAGGGCSVAVAGAGASLITTGIVGPTMGEFACAAAYRKTIKTAVEDNAQKWLTITPSVQSADWLAEKDIIAVVPAKESRVYANRKTITVSYDLISNAGGSRMTLKFSGT